jgi:hypothetical protein
VSEPDEALIWAMEQSGDDAVFSLADAYRAGQAASAERIKALEGALRDVIGDYDWVQGGPGDRDWNVLDNTIIRARALLKEADQ